LKLFFNCMPYDLVLFFFRVKFKYSFFSNLYFLNYFCFLINCFKFISNFFSWLGILHCCFFMFVFYVVIRLHDICHRFWKLNRVGFNYFLLCLQILSIIIAFVTNWYSLFFFCSILFCEFDFSFQFCLSIQYLMIVKVWPSMFWFFILIFSFFYHILIFFSILSLYS
jgi:hypothetical protein